VPRIRWRAQVAFSSANTVVQTIRASIGNVQQPYAMQTYVAGGQSATTTVTWAPNPAEAFTTSGQMHSEMRAVDAMLRNGEWTLTGHAITENVTAGDFSTDLQHCGWCTVMLAALNLPIGRPTAGRYNLAANLEYPVPAEVHDSADVVFYLFDSVHGNGAVEVKLALDACITTGGSDWVLQLPDGDFATDTAVVNDQPDGTEVLTWSDAMAHSIRVDLGAVLGEWRVLDMLWKLIYVGIYLQTR
jgi:hypothetical protein